VLNRYTEEEIKEVKSIPLELILMESGFKLEKQGSSLKTLCPFHSDKTASLTINVKTNLFKCFGCGTGGSNIDFLMKHCGLNFVDAVASLKEKHPHLIDSHTSLACEKKELDLFSVENQKVLREFVNYCHKNITTNKEALKYLEKRKLIESTLLKEFSIGYCDKLLYNKLPDGGTKEGKEIRNSYKELGLLGDLGHLHFAGHIIFPIFDKECRIVEIYGRRLYNKPDLSKHKYLPNRHHGIFNNKCLISKEIILCESIIDALSFWCHGYRNVTASYGAEGFSQEHLELFIDHKIKKVYLSFDNDKGGNLGSEKVKAKLDLYGIETQRLILPDEMDINDYICQSNNPKESLGELFTPSNPSISPLAVESSSLSTKVSPKESKQEESISFKSPEEDKSPSPNTNIREDKGDLYFNFGDREYLVKGLYKNTSAHVMKVYIKVSYDSKVHRDNNIDLISFKARMSLIDTVSKELNIDINTVKKDVDKILLSLENILEKRCEASDGLEKGLVILSQKEIEEAREYSSKEEFLDVVARDIEKCGFVGEIPIIKALYLSTISRLLSQPLNIMLYSASSAGKSTLVEKVLSFVPEEDKVEYSAITGQALYYMPETSLENKTLYIAEVGGFEKALYALKLLLSEGKLSLASVGPDPKTGQNIPIKSFVKGPVNAIFTVPDDYQDEELATRCLVLTLDESREQTRRIHAMQRTMRSIEGTSIKHEIKELIMLHQNIQRLIKALPIYNPYLNYLTFTDLRHRTRRDHKNYLSLIDTITLSYQIIRPRHTVKVKAIDLEHVRVTLRDIKLATDLANEVMGTSLDTLPPQTRKLLDLITELVRVSCTKANVDRSEYRFCRKELRETVGWGDTQLKLHLSRLVDYEYLIVHKKEQRYYYELIYNGEGRDGSKFILGLTDIETIKVKAIADGLKFEELFDK